MNRFTTQLCVYADDCSVALVTGGIEMGQGLNTKVAQAAAATLGIDLEAIKVKATDTFVASDNYCTGGSVGSDLAAKAAQIAAQDLRDRMDAAAADAGLQNPTWEELVAAAHKAGVDLSARHT